MGILNPSHLPYSVYFYWSDESFSNTTPDSFNLLIFTQPSTVYWAGSVYCMSVCLCVTIYLHILLLTLNYHYPPLYASIFILLKPLWFVQSTVLLTQPSTVYWAGSLCCISVSASVTIFLHILLLTLNYHSPPLYAGQFILLKPLSSKY